MSESELTTRLDCTMPAATKLNTAAPLAQLEIAGKLISENLQADATRVPELDVALVTGGGAHLFFHARSATNSNIQV